MSVDDFIDGALDYAQGHCSPKAANLAQNGNVTRLHPVPKLTLVANQEPKTRFPHVSFTFSHQAVSQLENNSKQHELAKSKLLRVLLNHFDQLPPLKQTHLLTSFAVR
ncbi:hypothetical protein GCM10007895_12810 [Paraferrimonas sedimenticola]|uniref:Uncharacterized protein n=2 Tax=Paraferrimonas sedimenticola TaxID=375674 RepID=A0AA37RUU2_9GAMM|nr:hypothetical protein GCM10007895_12810 [Paraferrimonas sedimenticola]